MRDIEIQRASARDESINLIIGDARGLKHRQSRRATPSGTPIVVPPRSPRHVPIRRDYRPHRRHRNPGTRAKRKTKKFFTLKSANTVAKIASRRTCTRDGVPTHRSKESVALRVGLNIVLKR